MTTNAQKATERIEKILDASPEYDFRVGDSEEDRHAALRDLLTDVMHAVDEWGFDAESLVNSAADVADEEIAEDESERFFEQASAGIADIPTRESAKLAALAPDIPNAKLCPECAGEVTSWVCPSCENRGYMIDPGHT